MLGALGQLLGRVGNTVNNDIVKPIQRDVVQPVQHAFNSQPVQQPGFTPAPMQHVNLTQGGVPNFGVPGIQQYQGNQARLNAQQQLQFTPSFTQNVVNAAPYVGQPVKTSGLTNSSGAAAEYFGQQQPNQIVLGNNKGGQDPSTVLHEGLHRIYDTNPQVRQQFDRAYNQSVTPAIKNYLTMRLQPYKGFSKGLDEGGVPIPNYDLSNINNLPANLQNEVHSFVSELPSEEMPLPTALNNYYSQYFNPTSAFKNGIQNRKVH